MARYVVDAPTLLHLVAGGVAVHPEHRLVAPNSLRSQALSLLYDQVRAGRLGKEEALGLHERMTALKIRLLGDRVSRRTAWRIARERGWRGGPRASCPPRPSGTWPSPVPSDG